MEQQTGSRIIGERYRIEKILHDGNMSRVYLGMDMDLEQKVVIKSAKKAENEIGWNSLINETEILSGLSHMAIPHIFDVYKRDDEISVIMEYKKGTGLDEMISRKFRCTSDQIKEITVELCEIMEYLHGQNPPIVHRDIKPENIIFGKQVSLVDFGAARRYTDKSRRDTICLGTIGYAAPEQFGEFGQSDMRTDIYGLGMTIKKLIEFSGNKNRKLMRIVNKCIQKEPEKRFQSVKDLKYTICCSEKWKGKPVRLIDVTMVHTSERINKKSNITY